MFYKNSIKMKKSETKIIIQLQEFWETITNLPKIAKKNTVTHYGGIWVQGYKMTLQYQGEGSQQKGGSLITLKKKLKKNTSKMI